MQLVHTYRYSYGYGGIAYKMNDIIITVVGIYSYR